MGRSYWFECARCGYRAKVSGRVDRGFNFFVQTIVCRDCKELYDAVTRIKVAATPGVKPESMRL
jgi:transcription elongation factor Elf1